MGRSDSRANDVT
jgi:hypothetical protein